MSSGQEVRKRKSAAVVCPSNAAVNPICHLLALLGFRYILHVSRIRLKDKRRYWNLQEDGREENGNHLR
jgi:hypothetical protein